MLRARMADRKDTEEQVGCNFDLFYGFLTLYNTPFQ